MNDLWTATTCQQRTLFWGPKYTDWRMGTQEDCTIFSVIFYIIDNNFSRIASNKICPHFCARPFHNYSTCLISILSPSSFNLHAAEVFFRITKNCWNSSKPKSISKVQSKKLARFSWHDINICQQQNILAFSIFCTRFNVRSNIFWSKVYLLTRQEQKTFRTYPISELEIESRRTLECG